MTAEHVALQDASAARNDFALEAGLAEMALVCLANSPAARLKFAEQVPTFLATTLVF